MSSLTHFNSPIKILNSDNNSNENSFLKNMGIRRATKNISYQSLKKLAHSKTFDNIQPKETDWKKDIIDYEQDKKNLKWGRNPPVRYYTKLYINSDERIFNPITQKYTDQLREEKLKQEEKTELINNISKCNDNEINSSQTYNIINLQDKLKGFENDRNYPQSPRVRRKKFYNLTPKINYNILSNLNYKIHHFDKPEKRPNIKLDKDNMNGLFNFKGNHINRIIITKGLKDYNILNNDYNENDKEKKKIDNEVHNLIASKKFFKRRKINPLTGIYYDEEQEKNFQEKKELMIKKLLNKKEEGLYNPFNFKVYDEEKLKEKDLLNSNKISRYRIRQQIDKYYHLRKEALDEKYLNSLKNKLSYDRYKQVDERGYDLLSNQEILSLKKDEKNSNDKNPWKLIKDGCNEHETISKSQHLLMRDKDDIFRKYANAKIKREEVIKKLPRLDSDPLFQIKKNRNKINFAFNKPKKITKTNSFLLDKKDWFNLRMSKDNSSYFLEKDKK